MYDYLSDVYVCLPDELAPVSQSVSRTASAPEIYTSVPVLPTVSSVPTVTSTGVSVGDGFLYSHDGILVQLEPQELTMFTQLDEVRYFIIIILLLL